MARDIPIGNGAILIAFDRNYQLREFHFPYVGQENHAGTEPFRLGIWCNDTFSWTDNGWEITKDYLDDSMATNVALYNQKLKIRISINDVLDFHENIYMRKIEVINTAGEKKNIKLFFSHDFQIYGNNIGDTAVYRPEVNALVHYKKERYFLINCFANGKFGIDSYATGNKKSGFEGTWKDAENGILSENPIAQGSVDSVVSINLKLKENQSERFFYWICAGKNFTEVRDLNSLVIKKQPEKIFKRTFNYWKLWSSIQQPAEDVLSEKVKRLYTKSLIILRTQINNCGSIIAANDSDAIQFNRDTYSYMWPRDGAITAYALDLAGSPELSRNFFTFCA